MKICASCGAVRGPEHDTAVCEDDNARSRMRYASARAAGLSSAEALRLSKKTGPMLVEVRQ